MDYSNGITVFIGNEGFYAEGELRDRAITLPVSGSELQGFLEGNGLVTPMHEETYIADFLDGVPFDHPEIFAHATAEQMNILAQQLKMADPDDFDVASADGQIGLSDRTDELRDAAQRQASVRGFSPFAVREGGER